MKVKGFAIVMALAALVQGQQSGAPTLEDTSGKFKIWGFISTGIEVVRGGFTFGMSGNPVRGQSLDQGIEFSCRNIQGQVTQQKGGPMRLQRATMKGDVGITVTGKDRGESKVNSESLTVEALDGETKVTSPGALTFRDVSMGSDGGARTLVFGAPAGTFLLDPLERLGGQPLRSARISGRTTVRVENRTKGVLTRVLDVAADSLVYDRGGRSLVLVGNVTLDGRQSPDEGPGFEGTMRGLRRVSVTFDENLEVSRIQAQGAPGSANVAEIGKGQ